MSLSYYRRNQLSDIPARTQVMIFVHRGNARSKKTEHLFDGEPSVRFSVPGCISLRLDPSHSSDMCWGKLPTRSTPINDAHQINAESYANRRGKVQRRAISTARALTFLHGCRICMSDVGKINTHITGIAEADKINVNRMCVLDEIDPTDTRRGMASTK